MDVKSKKIDLIFPCFLIQRFMKSNLKDSILPILAVNAASSLSFSARTDFKKLDSTQ
jgi:hypothetical protein